MTDKKDASTVKAVEPYEVQKIPLLKVDFSPWNPNEMDEKTFNRLVREIKEVGFLEPVQVIPYKVEGTDEERYRVVGGEHRCRALQVLGHEEVPAVILKGEVDFSDELFQKALTIRLNVLKGRLNKEKMVKIYQDVAKEKTEAEIQDLFAITHKDEWNKLVGETRKNLQKSGMPPELLAEYDKNMREARTVDDLGKIVQRLYEMYKDTVPFGFVVFTWGKKEHVYVAMNQKTKGALDKLLQHCKDNQIELNSILAPAFENMAEILSEDDEKIPESPPEK